MDWLWPGFLILLILIPLIIAAYVWMLRRKRVAVRYSSLRLVREAIPQHSWVRRHLPLAFFLLGLTSLIIALSRPVTVFSMPADQTTIILAIDVSRSMCSTDVKPSRIEAAEAAAQSFIQKQKPGTLIGIVAFSGFAELIQSPTSDQAALQAAIASLATGRRTAIGSGILKALDAIAEVDKNVAPSVADLSQGNEPPPVMQGAYAPDIIVLLTDGVSNAGPLPLEAAKQALDRGIRVFTIGFGTAGGVEFPRCPQSFLGGEPGGGFGGGGAGQPNRGQPGGGFGGYGGGQPGGRFSTRIDEAVLKQVAALTGGTYHSAESASELQAVFQNLPTNLILKHETTEISVVFTALATLLTAVGITLSMLWHPLP